MGPQLDSCGRSIDGEHVYAGTLLQWGRNLTVAEGGAVVAVHAAQLKASMGPQLDSCGRLAREVRAELDEVLQWGRNLTVAEGTSGKNFQR